MDVFWLLRVGGGAGGGPLFDATVLPVCWGLIDFILFGGAAGGGGGGGGALARRSFSGSLWTAPIGGSTSLRSASLVFFC